MEGSLTVTHSSLFETSMSWIPGSVVSIEALNLLWGGMTYRCWCPKRRFRQGHLRIHRG